MTARDACEQFACEAECVQRWLNRDSELHRSDELLTVAAYRWAVRVCELAGAGWMDDAITCAAEIARCNGVRVEADWIWQ